VHTVASAPIAEGGGSIAGTKVTPAAEAIPAVEAVAAVQVLDHVPALVEKERVRASLRNHVTNG